jgi:aryl-alcohol dehydrogenase-like predicted oxidoreductase
LGRTEIDVSVLSIGGLYTSSLAGGESETRRIIQRAIDLGVNAIDTAPAYADSEATLGRAISQLDGSLILTTKLGGRPQPFDAQDLGALRASFDESLRLLHRDHIDILMIHEPDRPQQYAWWTSYDPLDGPVLELIDQLKSSGKIRFAGLGGTTVTELTWLVRSDLFDVVLTAFNFSTLFREAAAELIPAAVAHDMGIVAGSTLGQGFLARRYDEQVRQKPIWLASSRQQQLLAYYALLDELGMSPVEMGLRFAISNADISTVPVGCKTTEQLEASVEAVAKGPLSEDVLRRLDEIASMVPARPFEEPMILPLGKTYYGPGMANVGAAVPVGKVESAEGGERSPIP